MIANRVYLGVLVVVALLGCSVQAFNMDHLCALVNDGLMVANDQDCGKYYSCKGGKAALNSCATNQYFDKDNQVCAPVTETTTCPFSPVQAGCTTKNIGQWVEVSTNCNAYYYCSANGPQMGYCPSGENFDPSKQMCVYSSQYSCPTSAGSTGSTDSSSDSAEDLATELAAAQPVNLCLYVKANIFFGSPSLCQGWLQCRNNELVTGLCPAGTNYNVLTSECEYVDQVVCSQVTMDPVLIVSQPPMKCTNGSYIIESSCSTFYQCNGTDLVLHSCPSGEFYDTVSKACVDRMEARNDCDRCEGSTATFVNSYSNSSCAGYLICQNGVTIGSGTCPTNAYFDEKLGGCLVGGADPDYACCNPNATVTSATTTMKTSVTTVLSTEAAPTTVDSAPTTTQVPIESSTAA